MGPDAAEQWASLRNHPLIPCNPGTAYKKHVPLLVASAAISRAQTGKYGNYKDKWRQFRINTRLWITLQSPRYDNFFPFSLYLSFLLDAQSV
jgi:hypothetical protein